MALKDVKSRISSIKNIQKITRAMEMVAAARLRRAEQRISVLRPYAGAIRRMTRQAAEAAGNVPNVPILNEHENEETVAILLVAADRGLPAPSTRRSSAPASASRTSSRARARRSSGTRRAVAGCRR
jgi:ATP synthase F1 gamma subunit